LFLLAFLIRKKKFSAMGRGIGRGIVGTGKGAGWLGGKALAGAGWTASNFPRFLKKEKKLDKRIKKLERKYQRAMNRNDLKSAEDFRKQIDWLRGELQRIETKEQKTERDYKRSVQKQSRNLPVKYSGSSVLAPTDKSQIKKSIKTLTREYNDIQRKNPRDPRLYQIVKDIKELRRLK
jgi:hypothetical protein